MAWKPLGWRCAFMSEIDAFPRAVLKHHHQDAPLHGDFTTIQAGDYDPIDILVGGTPCQSFSVAGLRGGMADDRGNLALEYLRLADRLRPKWLVWENVPGVLSSNAGRDFGSFVGGLGELGYGWAYRSLDAQFCGVPQRRERVFVVGYLGDWRRAAAVLFEPQSLRGDHPPRRQAQEGVAAPITPGSPGGSGYRNAADTTENLIASALRARDGARGVDSDCTDTLIANTLRSHPRPGSNSYGALAFGGNDTRGPIEIATACNAHGGPHGRLDFESETFIAHALRADGFDASEDGTGRGTPLVPVAFDTTQITNPHNRSNPHAGDPCHPLAAGAHPPAIAGAAVRRLTPKECERLQGFPDGYTRIPVRMLKSTPHTAHFKKYPDLYDPTPDGGWVRHAADGPRYKALGNSMAIPVMRWIGQRIASMETKGES